MPTPPNDKKLKPEHIKFLLKIAIAIIACVLSYFILALKSQPDGLLHAYFLNVGQGDSILLKGPSGQYVLIDGGPGNTVLTELKNILPYFNTKIDHIFLTHPDKDHIEGLVSVIQKYDIGEIHLISGYNESSLFEKFLRIAMERKIPVEISSEEADIKFDDGLILDVIYPPQPISGSGLSFSNASIVVHAVYGQESILLTGDAEEFEEQQILKTNADLKNDSSSYDSNEDISGNDSLRSDILKIAHHGSKTATGEELLREVSPTYAVISVGKNNSYNHPHQEVLDRLKNADVTILRTDELGTVEFIISKEEIVSINSDKQKIK